MSRVGRAVVTGLREAVGLLVDDGAVAIGVGVAVGLAALSAAPLGASDTVGWVLFGLVWAAMAISLRQASAAALLVRAEQVRFRLHPEGWPDRCDVGPADVAVAVGHPWAHRTDVSVVADDAELARLAVTALTRAVGPLVAAGRALAKVGSAALWAEVVDAFGLPVLHQCDLPVFDEVVARIHEALGAPGRPWRQIPDLRTADTPAGRAYLGRRAGCCLAYLCPEESDTDPADLDERHRAHLERFPERPGDPRYCTTCSMSELADCEQRQVFWLELENAQRAGASP